MKYFKIILLVLFIHDHSIYAQTFEKKFTGCVDECDYNFEFSKSGNFKKLTTGECGFEEVYGKYNLKNDTICVIKTHDKSKEFYIIENDTILVNIEDGFGYISYDDKYPKILKCRLEYPYLKTATQANEYNIQQFLNFAFNSETIKKFYHFDELPKRNFIIAEYHNLRAYIEVDGKIAMYKPKNEIKEKFYIEILDFSNSYFSFSITFKLHGEELTFNVWFNTPCTKCNVNTSIVKN